MSTGSNRYLRQMRFAALGEAGQRGLRAGHALVVGCGALGGAIADILVRAGVGRVRIVDRDFVELGNLHRQILFDEADAAEQLPKAIAAAEKLRRINSEVTVKPIVADVEAGNIESLCDGVDVILDGTDNFATRFLLNDVAVQRRLPWVYGGCLGAEGQTMTILPGETPCLRCLMAECPPPGSTPTCDTAGILAPIVHVIAAWEASEAIKLLSGNRAAVSRKLTFVDLWGNTFRQLDLGHLRDQVDCPTCCHGDYPWLEGREGGRSAVLCGRNAVQVSQAGMQLSLEELALRWAGVGVVHRNAFLVRLSVDGYELTVFADGRAIIAGTDDVATARTVYAKYLGN